MFGLPVVHCILPLLHVIDLLAGKYIEGLALGITFLYGSDEPFFEDMS